jgi:hypothetical protein
MYIARFIVYWQSTFLCISYLWSWRERALGVVAEVSPASWPTLTNQQATGKPAILHTSYISPQSGVGSRELNARQRLIVRPVSIPLLCCCSLDTYQLSHRELHSLFHSLFPSRPTSSSSCSSSLMLQDITKRCQTHSTPNTVDPVLASEAPLPQFTHPPVSHGLYNSAPGEIPHRHISPH